MAFHPASSFYARPTGKGRGRDALWPGEISLEGWKDIGKRVLHEFRNDRVLLVAAGGTFFMLLALFPALAAFVSLYGFVSDPETVADHIAMLGGLLPSAGREVIETQLRSLISKDEGSLSLGLIAGFGIALWSANSGIKTLFEAMNVAYDEREERSFLKLNLVTLLFTLSAMVVGILLLVGVGVVPAVLAIAGLGEQTELLVSILRWPVLFAVCWAAISVIYRYGPSRTRPKWRWIIWGSMASTAAWILGSILFSWYLQNFADYDATYGSLGAVIGLLMWTWLSLAILILGAEFNSEMEHQTRRDSTIGPETPMGTRSAVMADTVGSRYDRADARTGGGFHGRDTPVDSFAGDTRLASDRQQPSLGYILLTGALVLVIDAFLERRKRKGHRPD